jgi:hypothetical protein
MDIPDSLSPLLHRLEASSAVDVPLLGLGAFPSIPRLCKRVPSALFFGQRPAMAQEQARFEGLGSDIRMHSAVSKWRNRVDSSSQALASQLVLPLYLLARGAAAPINAANPSSAQCATSTCVCATGVCCRGSTAAESGD